ncbi:hypothetical protein QZH41_003401 [Actinostola sp. cb2023]|nr:hypothetical protein QZH41_003401 [Actinostola sp. cb2023]
MSNAENKLIKTVTDASVVIGIAAAVGYVGKKTMKESFINDPSSSLTNYDRKPGWIIEVLEKFKVKVRNSKRMRLEFEHDKVKKSVVNSRVAGPKPHVDLVAQVVDREGLGHRPTIEIVCVQLKVKLFLFVGLEFREGDISIQCTVLFNFSTSFLSYIVILEYFLSYIVILEYFLSYIVILEYFLSYIVILEYFLSYIVILEYFLSYIVILEYFLSYIVILEYFLSYIVILEYFLSYIVILEYFLSYIVILEYFLSYIVILEYFLSYIIILEYFLSYIIILEYFLSYIVILEYFLSYIVILEYFLSYIIT